MSKAKILLVDDTEKALNEEKEIVKDLKVGVYTAGSGKEALKALLAEKPEIVLLDLILPDMTGESIIKFIRSRPEMSNTSVIVVTARDAKDGLAQCFDIGCDAYVTKPFQKDDILNKIRMLLDEKGLKY
ncbi:MAG: response regulator [Proteobacteria bacterium]|nr:response regulator [Pseudomonadota bacterium]